MRSKRTAFVIFAVIVLAASAASAQQRFEGYSFEIHADRTAACPVRFLPQQGGRNNIQVFVAGTNRQRPATGLTACNNSRVEGNRIVPSGEDQRWCFEGPEELYEIGFSNGDNFLWPALSKTTGFYNVKDFRPVRRVEGTPARYTASEPADYTQAIRNAIAYIASRQGGTLQFPDGDYIVGTTDGNARNPSFEAITLPSGITIIGASGQYSVPTTNMPVRRSSTRIRLRNDKQSIFRIGGCTIGVTLRNIELLGNSPLFTEGPRSVEKTYGVEGYGGYSDYNTANTSQFIRFENVTFQNFDTGIYVHNTNHLDCSKPESRCYEWQFDNINIDHGYFVNNRTGIYVDTFNSDWRISNSQFNYMAANAPGTGIHIRRASGVLIEQTFGGGYNYDAQIGGTFLYIDAVGTLTMINSSAERGQRSIYTAPYGAMSSQMITVIGSIFGDTVELSGRLNYASVGNLYFGRTIKADPTVNISSLGDKFCHDPLIAPRQCTERPGGGAIVNDPRFGEARPMFKTGRLPEATGDTRLNRQPNLFGYDVEIASGLLQHDPNTTFRDITAMAAAAESGTRAKDGAIVYCKDCKKNNTGVCVQGQAGVDGAFAKRINGQWKCD